MCLCPSQVRAPLQTEVTAVHGRQQRRISLPHRSQPLAGGPNGNDPPPVHFTPVYGLYDSSCSCRWLPLLGSWEK